MPEKPKLSLYWASSCGGCEVAVVNLHEKFLELAAHFHFFFCPCLLDTKTKEVEALPDGGIAVTLFNGAIRTSENEELAHLLRKKSRLLIACGACSCGGGVPGLANLSRAEDLMKTVYLNNATVDNSGQVLPQAAAVVPEGTLFLPSLTQTVKSLDQVVDVDFFIPGCPPESARIWEVLNAVLFGEQLPPKGSVLGAGHSSVCHECERKKENKRIPKFFRSFEIIPAQDRCLLDQGLICMGVATRDGCGALCPRVNMPCTGCYGPPEGVFDQGAKMVSALGSIIDIGEARGLNEDELVTKIDAVFASVPDYAGLFYKYGLPGSLLKGKVE